MSNRDPNRLTKISFDLSNTPSSREGKITPQEAEARLVVQIARMGQIDPKQMPGANRAERKLLARKVRKAIPLLKKAKPNG